MPTPTNNWDLVLGLNQDFLSGLTSSLSASGRIPTSFSTEVSGCQVDLALSAPTVSFVNEAGDGSGDACGFTGVPQLLAVNMPAVGTMTCKGSVQELKGNINVKMNLAEIVLSAVSRPDYLQMDGLDGEWADCGDLAGTITGAVCTLEAWVRTTAIACQTVMLLGDSEQGLCLVGDILRLYWSGNYYESNFPEGAPIADGKWHHLAVTTDETGKIMFYKDGQAYEGVSLSDAEQPSGGLRLGAANTFPLKAEKGPPSFDSSAFDGEMTQVRVWNYARSTVQIQQAMNTTLRGDEGGLLGYWTFAGGAVVNLANGAQGTVAGGAQVVNLEADKLSYSLNMYFLNAANVFCASCTLSTNENTNEKLTEQIQGELDQAARAPADLGTFTGEKLGALLPTYGVTAGMGGASGDPAGYQLVLMMMTNNRPQPAGDPATMFEGDAAIALPPGSNLVFAVWDYYLLGVLLPPVMAQSLDLDVSSIMVTQDPVVLTIDEKMKTGGGVRLDGKEKKERTLYGLTMKITEEGLYIETEVKQKPLIVPWIVTLSFTLAVTVNAPQELKITVLNPSISFEGDDSGSGGSVMDLPGVSDLIELIAGLWESLIGPLKSTSTTLPIDLDALTLTNIVYGQGIQVFADFALETPAPAALSAAPRQGDGAAAQVEEPSASDPSGAPVISGFSPAAGAANTLVTILGTGFTGADSVKFKDTTAGYFKVKSDTEILARPGQEAAPGPISVTTPAGTAVSQTSFAFLTPPVIDGFSVPDPDAEVQLPGVTVTITGSNFEGASAVKFGNTNVPATVFSVNSNTEIDADIPNGAVSGPIYVTAPGGQAVSKSIIHIGSAQVPTVLSFSPEVGVPGNSVTIDGENFAGAESVNFNDVPSNSFTLLSDSQLVAYVPDFPQRTTGPLAVTNNQGTSAPAGNFTVTPRPSNLSFDPASGGLGQAVTIKGNDLGGATSVTFGSNTIQADFEVLSDSQIETAVPAGAVAGPLSVTTRSGTAISEGTFTVLSGAPPAGLSFTPDSGGPGAPVTISGSNFTGTTLLTFNGAGAEQYTVQSDTEIVAVVPPDATTGPIAVTNNTDPPSTKKSAQTFQVYPSPQIGAFDHSMGGAGSTLQISGKNFTGATSVTFGPYRIPAETFNVSVDSFGNEKIVVTVPGGAVDGSIAVTTPGGTAVSEQTFKVTNSAAPADITCSPSSGVVGAEVTIQGRNFTGTTALTFFDQIEAASVRVESDTSLIARVPRGASTGRITITNRSDSGAPASGTSADAFSVKTGSDDASV